MSITVARTRLDDVRMGSHFGDGRWTQRVGRYADAASIDFEEHGDWSVSCNLDRIGPGTIGWICRHGDPKMPNPPLVAAIVCDDVPYEDTDGEWYVPGVLVGGLWVPGPDIAAAGWPSTQAPWGDRAVRQFSNGQRIDPASMAGVLGATPEAQLRHISLEHERITGGPPWWS